MFLWVVLLILTGFLIGKRLFNQPCFSSLIVGHHFFRSGSIADYVNSPEAEEIQTPAKLARSEVTPVK